MASPRRPCFPGILFAAVHVASATAREWCEEQRSGVSSWSPPCTLFQSDWKALLFRNISRVLWSSSLSLLHISCQIFYRLEYILGTLFLSLNPLSTRQFPNRIHYYRRPESQYWVIPRGYKIDYDILCPVARRRGKIMKIVVFIPGI